MKQFKLISLAVALLTVVPMSAYDFEVDGIYYKLVSAGDFTCSVVSGDVKYKGNLAIPSTINYSGKTLTVVQIAANAFSGCSDLTGITIPNTIASIGNNTFWDCSKLERVVFEDGETTLNLGNNTYTYADVPLFRKCPLTSLYIGRNLSYNKNETGRYAPFKYQSALKELIIGDSVTMIEDYLLSECGAPSVTIGNSVVSIGRYAFEKCRNLTNVTIPNSVTQMGVGAFYGCSNLASITIGNSVTEINGGTFSECSNLASITIGNSVTRIGDFAFEKCRSLTNVVIPNSVTYIGNSAFWNCSSLTSVTLGNAVAEVESYAFRVCDALTELYSLNTTPPKTNKGSFANNQYMTINVYVPHEALEAYQSADGWKNFWTVKGIAGTSIDNVDADTENSNVYYDLRGNRLNTPKRGINIINGKKVMVK